MKTAILNLIKFYQSYISGVFGQRCRFYPCCSDYALEAIKSFGLFLGGIKTVHRLLRCHPFSCGGYDPVKKGTDK